MFRLFSRLLVADGRLTLLLLLVWLVVPAASAIAQDEALATDRPGFTDSTSVLTPRRVQLETGYTYTDAGAEETQTFGEVLVRIGWTELLELRLGVNSYVTVDGPRTEVSGWEDPSIGVRLRLADGSAEPRLLGPQVALFFGTTLPIGADELGSPHFQPSSKLSMAWALPGRLSLTSNLGVAWSSDEKDEYLEGLASLNLGIAVTGNLGAFVEYFVSAPESSAGPTEQYVDAGLAWGLAENLQLDIRAGTQVGGGETDFFAGAGLVYRW